MQKSQLINLLKNNLSAGIIQNILDKVIDENTDLIQYVEQENPENNKDINTNFYFVISNVKFNGFLVNLYIQGGYLSSITWNNNSNTMNLRYTSIGAIDFPNACVYQDFFGSGNHQGNRIQLDPTVPSPLTQFNLCLNQLVASNPQLTSVNGYWLAIGY